MAARPSPAQLLARREFVRRFGHKKTRQNAGYVSGKLWRCMICDRTFKTEAKLRAHIRHEHMKHENPRHRRNSEGEHHAPVHHHAAHAVAASHGAGWLMPVLLIGGAFLLLPRLAGAGSLFGGGSIFGGGTGYTPVGTDSTGHPIYAGAPGSVAPPGYVQTGVSPTGQPIYSYGGGSVLGTVAPIVAAGSGIVGLIGKLFGGGSGGAGTTGSTLPGGGSSTTSPDILTGGGGGGGGDFGLPDIGLPDLTLSSIGLPSWMTDWMSGVDPFNPVPVSFDMPDTVIPTLSLDLSPITTSLPDFSDIFST